MIDRLDQGARSRLALTGHAWRDGWLVVRAIGHRAAEHQAVLLLALVYLAIVLPTSALVRITGRDLLTPKPMRLVGTGWRSRAAVSVDERLY